MTTEPATSRGRATRDRIVAGASELIHERGVASTSLDDVMAATSTSKSQLYHYFSDKSSLVRAVIAYQIEQVVDAQGFDLGPLDTIEALRAWRDRIVHISELSDGVGGCPIARLAGQLAENDREARETLDAGFARWHAGLEAGLRLMVDRHELSGNPEALALGLLAAAQGGLVLAQTARSAQPVGTALDFAIDGIEARRMSASSPPAARRRAARPTRA